MVFLSAATGELVDKSAPSGALPPEPPKFSRHGGIAQVVLDRLRGGRGSLLASPDGQPSPPHPAIPRHVALGTSLFSVARFRFAGHSLGYTLPPPVRNSPSTASLSILGCLPTQATRALQGPAPWVIGGGAAMRLRRRAIPFGRPLPFIGGHWRGLYWR
jgi:hypothetical protein